jgi:DNA polymerase
MKYIIDLETYSEADLELVGSRIYAEHPSTDVICAGYGVTPQRFGWLPGHRAPVFPPGVTFAAHNDGFDYRIWKNILRPKYGWQDPDIFVWEDLMLRCRAYAVPGKLEDAAKFLSLGESKDKVGNTLMRRMSRPGPQFLEHTPENVARLSQYCEQDVVVEQKLDARLPPLTPLHHRYDKIDERVNEYGCRLDLPLIDKMMAIAAEYCETLDSNMCRMTGGRVTKATQHQRLGKFLFEDLGVEPIMKKRVRDDGTVDESPTVDKDAIAEYLQRDNLHPTARLIMKNRAERNKSSLAKLETMKERVSPDGRLRDIISLFAALETGRFASYGTQVHNLPKGIFGNSKELSIVEEYDYALDIIRNGSVEDLLVRYGEDMSDPAARPVLMDILSSVLRACFIPKDGHVFVMSDFNAVEPRIAGWLCGDETLMADFRDAQPGRPDVYMKLAASILGKRPEDVTKKERNTFGKPGIIGGGYGMGAARMQGYAEQFGATFDFATAQRLITGFRSRYDAIPRGWREYERAAIRAVKRNMVTESGRIRFFPKNGGLALVLPAGRELFMHGARIVEEPSRFDEARMEEKLAYRFHTSKGPKFDTIWGGVILEHVDQATGTDLLVEGIDAAHQAGYDVALHVHDEIVVECPESKADEAKKTLVQIMSQAPKWAQGLPLAAEASVGTYYRK